MKPILYLLLSICFHTSFGQYEYLVKLAERQSIKIDGKSNDPAWQKALELTDFRNHWSDQEMPKTSFKGLYNEDHFYFLYDVVDSNIVMVDNASLGEEGQAVGSDRIEIFIRQKDNSRVYYSLEMDANARVFDSQATFGELTGIDSEWDWPVGQLELKSSFTDEGYIVEGRISITSLKTLGLLDGDKLYAGLYRGEYVPIQGKKPSIEWISWANPESARPNFHIPSSFGILKFKK